MHFNLFNDRMTEVTQPLCLRKPQSLCIKNFNTGIPLGGYENVNSTLPDTTEVIAEYPYFPTRQQLFIWRNWGMVKTETIAEVLGTDVETVNGLYRRHGTRRSDEV